MSSNDPYQLLKEAEQNYNYKGWFGGNKLDEAADLYQAAANQFKLQKKPKEAGDAFLQQANCYIKANEKDEASSAFINASKSFRKTHPMEAITCLKKAVQILSEKGRFQTAANNQKVIAEMFEVDLENNNEALGAYEIAAEWYQGEDSNAQANACNLKAASLSALQEDYIKAIEKFEAVATQSLDNNLTKWSAREYLLKAGICLLCSLDFVRARQSLERYTALDMTFSGTREYKFISELLDAVESGDVEQYTNTIVDFDRMTKLDNWKTTLLLRVKKSIASEELDFT